MKVVGLTGGIGSGKSTVAHLLAELGARVIDADRIGHEVYAPATEGWRQVVAAFGDEVVADDGTIDRGRLGTIVFSNSDRLALLNRIVHPLIAEAVRRRLAAWRAEGGDAPVVLDAAVLIEAGWQSLVDEVWVVVAAPELVMERMRARRGFSDDRLAARMRAQLSDADRRRHADVVIENSGPETDLRAQVERLWKERLSATARE